jgi:glycosyltransferase involved in cell wall biosynthesis
MEGGLPADKITVKPNFVVDPGPTGAGPRSGFVYVGRLAEAKGVPVLLEAWRTLRSRGNAPVLTIAGDGPLHDVVAREAARHDEIRFLGKIERSEVLDLVRSTRCLILPSSWEETFGLTVVEAFAVGTPAIATLHGSFPDIVTHDHDGLLVEPDDASALADAVSRLEDDEAMVGRMGAQARETYLERFTPDVVMEQLEAVYDEVVDARRTDPPERLVDVEGGRR